MKIRFILDSIDQGTVVLPEFQRGYVWSRNQIRGLFQSLYNRYPVGGLLIWNTSASETGLRGDDTPVSGNVKLLLDGQQRVTSLYGVIRGKPPQFFEDPTKGSLFAGLHFHLENQTFEFYRSSKMSGDPLWVSVTDVMTDGSEAVLEDLQGSDDVDPRRLIPYMKRLELLRGITDIELHDENISGESMTVDVVVDIFNRVNSGGTKLSKGDLALARICAIRPEAREELRDAIAEWDQAGYSLQLDWLLRCVNVVSTGSARFEAMHNISSDDFGLAFKQTTKAIDFILNLLSTRLGLDHDRVLMGRYGFPAMVKVVVDHGGKLTEQDQQNELLYWYIHQAMWGRYSSSTESTLAQDLTAYEEDGVTGLIQNLERSRGTLVVRPDDFDSHTVGSRFYPVLYMLTRVNDARDFCSGLPLSQNLLGKGSRLELHHIFPKAMLYDAHYSRNEVNAVANMAFLTGDCNRSLGRRDPVEYFAEVEQNQPGALASQWVGHNRNLWETDRYLDFLRHRRILLAQATNELLDRLQSGSQTQVVAAPGSWGCTEEDGQLGDLQEWCRSFGLAVPDVPAEIIDPETGEVLVYPDAAWPEGMQEGMSEKVAIILDPNPEEEGRLGALGYRFFTDLTELTHYVEDLLDIDIDGDGDVGAQHETPKLSEFAREDEPAENLDDDGRQSANSAHRDRVEVNDQRPDEQTPEAFHQEMLRCIGTLQREINYNPTRFRQMVNEHGGLEAARRLVRGANASDGFTTLWENGRLDMSVEWFCLVYDDLFNAQERQAAHERLKLHDAPVDDWLQSRLGRRWP